MSPRLPEESQGLRASLTTLASSLYALAQTRLELLSLDLDEGRQRLASMLLAGLGAMLAIGIGSVLGVLAVLLAVGQAYRLPTLIGLAGLSLLVGTWAAVWVLRRVQAAPSIFAASLAELERDRQQLHQDP